MSEWLRSRSASRLFLCSACTTLAWGTALMFTFSPLYPIAESQTWSSVLVDIVLSLLVSLAVPASLTIFLGMTLFLVKEDKCRRGIKVVWFVLFLTTLCFGASAYFFAIYTKQVQTGLAAQDHRKLSDWLRAYSVQRVFLYSAWIVVGTGLLFTFMLTPWFSNIHAYPKADLLLRICILPLAISAPFATLIIMFGMMICCAFDKHATTTNKILWFFLFLTTACFGATAYFFTVHKKQMRVATS
jgi:hypothetical protein